MAKMLGLFFQGGKSKHFFQNRAQVAAPHRASAAKTLE
jgi:hypothetical protein